MASTSSSCANERGFKIEEDQPAAVVQKQMAVEGYTERSFDA